MPFVKDQQRHIWTIVHLKLKEEYMPDTCSVAVAALDDLHSGRQVNTPTAVNTMSNSLLTDQYMQPLGGVF